MKYSYGIMQGRLSQIIGNKIQAFPTKYWKLEFSKARKLGLKSIEWTLDYKNLENLCRGDIYYLIEIFH